MENGNELAYTADMDRQVGRSELRIPKSSIAVVCHTLYEGKLEGEIFLDLAGSPIGSQHLLDYFNMDTLFFPLRKADSPKPILLQKESLLRVDIPGKLNIFEEEPSFALAGRRMATLYMQQLGPLTAQVLLELPVDHYRILDLLNSRHAFIPVILEGNYVLLNVRHIYKIEEE